MQHHHCLSSRRFFCAASLRHFCCDIAHQVLNDLQLGLNDDEIGEWQKHADTDGSGTVKWSEFEPAAANLVTQYYSNHASEEPWRDATDGEGNTYRVNLATGNWKIQ